MRCVTQAVRRLMSSFTGAPHRRSSQAASIRYPSFHTRGEEPRLRRRIAGIPGTRRRARTDHGGRRDAGRRAHGHERASCACRAFSAIRVWPPRWNEDVNDAERLRHDPAMRWIVGGKAAHGCAASPSQMGRFETKWLAAEKNLSALTDLSGQWIDRVHCRRPPKGVVLDM